MLTASQLEAAFHVYIPQLENVRESKCYWPVLHLILTLPDICAALQSPEGETDRDLYADWCANYLPGPLDGADWYKMRCSVLHLGSSIPQKRGKLQSKFASFSFVDPEHCPDPRWHQHTRVDESGLNVTLNIAELANEMVRAVRAWFVDVASPQNQDVAAHVLKNLPQLVRIQPKDLLDVEFVDDGTPERIAKPVFVELRTITTSST